MEITADPAAPLCAYVFKTVADPFVGKMSFIKVLSGKLTAASNAINARTGQPERLGKTLTRLRQKADRHRRHHHRRHRRCLQAGHRQDR